MIPPRVYLKELWIGDKDIVRRGNIKEFFSYISGLHEHNYKSIVEVCSSYEEAIAMLVEVAEAKFVNLNPTIQQMFFKLDNMEDEEELC